MTENLSLTSLRPEEGGEGEESQKVLFRTHDNHLLESVLISQSGRQTVCLSTQLGCKVGCPFCASGKGPFGRDFTAGEIVEQVVWIGKLAKKKITNVVFMGMGEPLDNFDQTMKALEILTEKWGFGMGGRRIINLGDYPPHSGVCGKDGGTRPTFCFASLKQTQSPQ